MQRETAPEKPRIWQPIDSQVTLWRGCDSGGVLPRHAHEEFQVVLNLSHPYEFNYRRRNSVVPPGHLAVLQTGEPHSSCSADRLGQTLRLMFFNEMSRNSPSLLSVCMDSDQQINREATLFS